MNTINIVIGLLTFFIICLIINDYYQNKKNIWKEENENGLFENNVTEGFYIPSKFGFQRNVNRNLESSFLKFDHYRVAEGTDKTYKDLIPYQLKPRNFSVLLNILDIGNKYQEIKEKITINNDANVSDVFNFHLDAALGLPTEVYPDLLNNYYNLNKNQEVLIYKYIDQLITDNPQLTSLSTLNNKVLQLINKKYNLHNLFLNIVKTVTENDIFKNERNALIDLIDDQGLEKISKEINKINNTSEEINNKDDYYFTRDYRLRHAGHSAEAAAAELEDRKKNLVLYQVSLILKMINEHEIIPDDFNPNNKSPVLFSKLYPIINNHDGNDRDGSHFGSTLDLDQLLDLNRKINNYVVQKENYEKTIGGNNIVKNNYRTKEGNEITSIIFMGQDFKSHTIKEPLKYTVNNGIQTFLNTYNGVALSPHLFPDDDLDHYNNIKNNEIKRMENKLHSKNSSQLNIITNTSVTKNYFDQNKKLISDTLIKDKEFDTSFKYDVNYGYYDINCDTYPLNHFLTVVTFLINENIKNHIINGRFYSNNLNYKINNNKDIKINRIKYENQRLNNINFGTSTGISPRIHTSCNKIDCGAGNNRFRPYTMPSNVDNPINIGKPDNVHREVNYENYCKYKVDSTSPLTVNNDIEYQKNTCETKGCNYNNSSDKNHLPIMNYIPQTEYTSIVESYNGEDPTVTPTTTDIPNLHDIFDRNINQYNNYKYLKYISDEEIEYLKEESCVPNSDFRENVEEYILNQNKIQCNNNSSSADCINHECKWSSTHNYCYYNKTDELKYDDDDDFTTLNKRINSDPFYHCGDTFDDQTKIKYTRIDELVHDIIIADDTTVDPKIFPIEDLEYTEGEYFVGKIENLESYAKLSDGEILEKLLTRGPIFATITNSDLAEEDDSSYKTSALRRGVDTAHTYIDFIYGIAKSSSDDNIYDCFLYSNDDVIFNDNIINLDFKSSYDYESWTQPASTGYDIMSYAAGGSAPIENPTDNQNISFNSREYNERRLPIEDNETESSPLTDTYLKSNLFGLEDTSSQYSKLNKYIFKIMTFGNIPFEIRQQLNKCSPFPFFDSCGKYGTTCPIRKEEILHENKTCKPESIDSLYANGLQDAKVVSINEDAGARFCSCNYERLKKQDEIDGSNFLFCSDMDPDDVYYTLNGYTFYQDKKVYASCNGAPSQSGMYNEVPDTATAGVVFNDGKCRPGYRLRPNSQNIVLNNAAPMGGDCTYPSDAGGEVVGSLADGRVADHLDSDGYYKDTRTCSSYAAPTNPYVELTPQDICCESMDSSTVHLFKGSDSNIDPSLISWLNDIGTSPFQNTSYNYGTGDDINEQLNPSLEHTPNSKNTKTCPSRSNNSKSLFDKFDYFEDYEKFNTVTGETLYNIDYSSIKTWCEANSLSSSNSFCNIKGNGCSVNNPCSVNDHLKTKLKEDYIKKLNLDEEVENYKIPNIYSENENIIIIGTGENLCYSYSQWWPAKRDTWIDFETTYFIRLLTKYFETNEAAITNSYNWNTTTQYNEIQKFNTLKTYFFSKEYELTSTTDIVSSLKSNIFNKYNEGSKDWIISTGNNHDIHFRNSLEKIILICLEQTAFGPTHLQDYFQFIDLFDGGSVETPTYNGRKICDLFDNIDTRTSFITMMQGFISYLIVELEIGAQDLVSYARSYAPHEFESKNDYISRGLIEYIETKYSDIDVPVIKYWHIKKNNGNNIKIRRFTDDNYNLDLSIKDLILSPQYEDRHLTKTKGVVLGQYKTINTYLSGRFEKPKVFRQIPKGFELLKQYKSEFVNYRLGYDVIESTGIAFVQAFKLVYSNPYILFLYRLNEIYREKKNSDVVNIETDISVSNSENIIARIEETYGVSGLEETNGILNFQDRGGAQILGEEVTVNSLQIFKISKINELFHCAKLNYKTPFGEIPLYGDNRKLFDDLMNDLWIKNEEIVQDFDDLKDSGDTNTRTPIDDDNYKTNNIQNPDKPLLRELDKYFKNNGTTLETKLTEFYNTDAPMLTGWINTCIDTVSGGVTFPGTGHYQLDTTITADTNYTIDRHNTVLRLYKIHISMELFKILIKIRKNKARDNYKRILEDILMANNSHNLSNFSVITIDPSPQTTSAPTNKCTHLSDTECEGDSHPECYWGGSSCNNVTCGHLNVNKIQGGEYERIRKSLGCDRLLTCEEYYTKIEDHTCSGPLYRSERFININPVRNCTKNDCVLSNLSLNSDCCENQFCDGGTTPCYTTPNLRMINDGCPDEQINLFDNDIGIYNTNQCGPLNTEAPGISPITYKYLHETNLELSRMPDDIKTNNFNQGCLSLLSCSANTGSECTTLLDDYPHNTGIQFICTEDHDDGSDLYGACVNVFVKGGNHQTISQIISLDNDNPANHITRLPCNLNGFDDSSQHLTSASFDIYKDQFNQVCGPTKIAMYKDTENIVECIPLTCDYNFTKAKEHDETHHNTYIKELCQKPDGSFLNGNGAPLTYQELYPPQPAAAPDPAVIYPSPCPEGSTPVQICKIPNTISPSNPSDYTYVYKGSPNITLNNHDQYVMDNVDTRTLVSECCSTVPIMLANDFNADFQNYAPEETKNYVNHMREISEYDMSISFDTDDLYNSVQQILEPPLPGDGSIINKSYFVNYDKTDGNGDIQLEYIIKSCDNINNYGSSNIYDCNKTIRLETSPTDEEDLYPIFNINTKYLSSDSNMYQFGDYSSKKQFIRDRTDGMIVDDSTRTNSLLKEIRYNYRKSSDDLSIPLLVLKLGPLNKSHTIGKVDKDIEYYLDTKNYQSLKIKIHGNDFDFERNYQILNYKKYGTGDNKTALLELLDTDINKAYSFTSFVNNYNSRKQEILLPAGSGADHHTIVGTDVTGPISTVGGDDGISANIKYKKILMDSDSPPSFTNMNVDGTPLNIQITLQKVENICTVNNNIEGVKSKALIKKNNHHTCKYCYELEPVDDYYDLTYRKLYDNTGAKLTSSPEWSHSVHAQDLDKDICKFQYGKKLTYEYFNTITGFKTSCRETKDEGNSVDTAACLAVTTLETSDACDAVMTADDISVPACTYGGSDKIDTIISTFYDKVLLPGVTLPDSVLIEGCKDELATKPIYCDVCTTVELNDAFDHMIHNKCLEIGVEKGGVSADHNFITYIEPGSFDNGICFDQSGVNSEQSVNGGYDNFLERENTCTSSSPHNICDIYNDDTQGLIIPNYQRAKTDGNGDKYDICIRPVENKCEESFLFGEDGQGQCTGNAMSKIYNPNKQCGDNVCDVDECCDVNTNCKTPSSVTQVDYYHRDHLTVELPANTNISSVNVNVKCKYDNKFIEIKQDPPPGSPPPADDSITYSNTYYVDIDGRIKDGPQVVPGVVAKYKPYCHPSSGYMKIETVGTSPGGMDMSHDMCKSCSTITSDSKRFSEYVSDRDVQRTESNYDTEDTLCRASIPGTFPFCAATSGMDDIDINFHCSDEGCDETGQCSSRDNYVFSTNGFRDETTVDSLLTAPSEDSIIRCQGRDFGIPSNFSSGQHPWIPMDEYFGNHQKWLDCRVKEDTPGPGPWEGCHKLTTASVSSDWPYKIGLNNNNDCSEQPLSGYICPDGFELSTDGQFCNHTVHIGYDSTKGHIKLAVKVGTSYYDMNTNIYGVTISDSATGGGVTYCPTINGTAYSYDDGDGVNGPRCITGPSSTGQSTATTPTEGPCTGATVTGSSTNKQCKAGTCIQDYCYPSYIYNGNDMDTPSHADAAADQLNIAFSNYCSSFTDSSGCVSSHFAGGNSCAWGVSSTSCSNCMDYTSVDGSSGHCQTECIDNYSLGRFDIGLSVPTTSSHNIVSNPNMCFQNELCSTIKDKYVTINTPSSVSGTHSPIQTFYSNLFGSGNMDIGQENKTIFKGNTLFNESSSATSADFCSVDHCKYDDIESVCSSFYSTSHYKSLEEMHFSTSPSKQSTGTDDANPIPVTDAFDSTAYTLNNENGISVSINNFDGMYFDEYISILTKYDGMSSTFKDYDINVKEHGWDPDVDTDTGIVITLPDNSPSNTNTFYFYVNKYDDLDYRLSQKTEYFKILLETLKSRYSKYIYDSDFPIAQIYQVNDVPPGTSEIFIGNIIRIEDDDFSHTTYDRLKIKTDGHDNLNNLNGGSEYKLIIKIDPCQSGYYKSTGIFDLSTHCETCNNPSVPWSSKTPVLDIDEGSVFENIHGIPGKCKRVRATAGCTSTNLSDGTVTFKDTANCVLTSRSGICGELYPTVATCSYDSGVDESCPMTLGERRASYTDKTFDINYETDLCDYTKDEGNCPADLNAFTSFFHIQTDGPENLTNRTTPGWNSSDVITTCENKFYEYDSSKSMLTCGYRYNIKSRPDEEFNVLEHADILYLLGKDIMPTYDESTISADWQATHGPIGRIDVVYDDDIDKYIVQFLELDNQRQLRSDRQNVYYFDIESLYDVRDNGYDKDITPVSSYYRRRHFDSPRQNEIENCSNYNYINSYIINEAMLPAEVDGLFKNTDGSTADLKVIFDLVAADEIKLIRKIIDTIHQKEDHPPILIYDAENCFTSFEIISNSNQDDIYPKKCNGPSVNTPNTPNIITLLDTTDPTKNYSSDDYYNFTLDTNIIINGLSNDICSFQNRPFVYNQESAETDKEDLFNSLDCSDGQVARYIFPDSSSKCIIGVYGDLNIESDALSESTYYGSSSNEPLATDYFNDPNGPVCINTANRTSAYQGLGYSTINYYPNGVIGDYECANTYYDDGVECKNCASKYNALFVSEQPIISATCEAPAPSNSWSRDSFTNVTCTNSPRYNHTSSGCAECTEPPDNCHALPYGVDPECLYSCADPQTACSLVAKCGICENQYYLTPEGNCQPCDGSIGWDPELDSGSEAGSITCNADNNPIYIRGENYDPCNSTHYLSDDSVCVACDALPQEAPVHCSKVSVGGTNKIQIEKCRDNHYILDGGNSDDSCISVTSIEPYYQDLSDDNYHYHKCGANQKPTIHGTSPQYIPVTKQQCLVTAVQPNSCETEGGQLILHGEETPDSSQCESISFDGREFKADFAAAAVASATNVFGDGTASYRYFSFGGDSLIITDNVGTGITKIPDGPIFDICSRAYTFENGNEPSNPDDNGGAKCVNVTSNKQEQIIWYTPTSGACGDDEVFHMSQCRRIVTRDELVCGEQQMTEQNLNSFNNDFSDGNVEWAQECLECGDDLYACRDGCLSSYQYNQDCTPKNQCYESSFVNCVGDEYEEPYERTDTVELTSAPTSQDEFDQYCCSCATGHARGGSGETCVPIISCTEATHPTGSNLQVPVAAADDAAAAAAAANNLCAPPPNGNVYGVMDAGVTCNLQCSPGYYNNAPDITDIYLSTFTCPSDNTIADSPTINACTVCPFQTGCSEQKDQPECGISGGGDIYTLCKLTESIHYGINAYGIVEQCGDCRYSKIEDGETGPCEVLEGGKKTTSEDQIVSCDCGDSTNGCIRQDGGTVTIDGAITWSDNCAVSAPTYVYPGKCRIQQCPKGSYFMFPLNEGVYQEGLYDSDDYDYGTVGDFVGIPYCQAANQSVQNICSGDSNLPYIYRYQYGPTNDDHELLYYCTQQEGLNQKPLCDFNNTFSLKGLVEFNDGRSTASNPQFPNSSNFQEGNGKYLTRNIGGSSHGRCMVRQEQESCPADYIKYKVGLDVDNICHNCGADGEPTSLNYYNYANHKLTYNSPTHYCEINDYDRGWLGNTQDSCRAYGQTFIPSNPEVSVGGVPQGTCGNLICSVRNIECIKADLDNQWESTMNPFTNLQRDYTNTNMYGKCYYNVDEDECEICANKGGTTTCGLGEEIKCGRAYAGPTSMTSDVCRWCDPGQFSNQEGGTQCSACDTTRMTAPGAVYKVLEQSIALENRDTMWYGSLSSRCDIKTGNISTIIKCDVGVINIGTNQINCTDCRSTYSVRERTLTEPLITLNKHLHYNEIVEIEHGIPSVTRYSSGVNNFHGTSDAHPTDGSHCENNIIYGSDKCNYTDNDVTISRRSFSGLPDSIPDTDLTDDELGTLRDLYECVPLNQSNHSGVISELSEYGISTPTNHHIDFIEDNGFPFIFDISESLGIIINNLVFIKSKVEYYNAMADEKTHGGGTRTGSEIFCLNYAEYVGVLGKWDIIVDVLKFWGLYTLFRFPPAEQVKCTAEATTGGAAAAGGDEGDDVIYNYPWDFPQIKSQGTMREAHCREIDLKLDRRLILISWMEEGLKNLKNYISTPTTPLVPEESRQKSRIAYRYLGGRITTYKIVKHLRNNIVCKFNTNDYVNENTDDDIHSSIMIFLTGIFLEKIQKFKTGIHSNVKYDFYISSKGYYNESTVDYEGLPVGDNELIFKLFSLNDSDSDSDSIENSGDKGIVRFTDPLKTSGTGEDNYNYQKTFDKKSCEYNDSLKEAYCISDLKINPQSGNSDYGPATYGNSILKHRNMTGPVICENICQSTGGGMGSEPIDRPRSDFDVNGRQTYRCRSSKYSQEDGINVVSPFSYLSPVNVESTLDITVDNDDSTSVADQEKHRFHQVTARIGEVLEIGSPTKGFSYIEIPNNQTGEYAVANKQCLYKYYERDFNINSNFHIGYDRFASRDPENKSLLYEGPGAQFDKPLANLQFSDIVVRGSDQTQPEPPDNSNLSVTPDPDILDDYRWFYVHRSHYTSWTSDAMGNYYSIKEYEGRDIDYDTAVGENQMKYCACDTFEDVSYQTPMGYLFHVFDDDDDTCSVWDTGKGHSSDYCDQEDETGIPYRNHPVDENDRDGHVRTLGGKH